MWDMTSGRSRGYGFCSFVERTDAERAVKEMQGRWLSSRQIRCNWANLKLSTSPIEALLTNPGKQQLDTSQQYLLVLSQTAENISTVYLGNLSCDTEIGDIDILFCAYGGSEEIKLHADRGFAFVRLASHDSAALAIVQLQGRIVKGRPVKMSCKCDSYLILHVLIIVGQNKADAKARQRSVSNVAIATLPQSVYSLQPSAAHNLSTSQLLTSEQARWATPRHHNLPSSTFRVDGYESWHQQIQHVGANPFAYDPRN